MSLHELLDLRRTVHDDFIRTIDFWLNHSIDKEHGGYYDCLDFDGTVYDTTKHVWLQGRQVWMLSRIYLNDILKNDPIRRAKVYNAAKHGIDFLVNKTIYFDKNTNLHRCWFSVTKEGNRLAIQRKIFSETFFVQALFVYSAMIREESNEECMKYLKLALQVFKDIQEYIGNPKLLGQPLKSVCDYEPQNVNMICLNLIDELRILHTNLFNNNKLPIFTKQELEKLGELFINNIIKHIDWDNKCTRELVRSNGTFDNNTCDGRMLMPGHSIECSWFIYEYARKWNINKLNNISIKDTALLMYDWSWNIGWDNNNNSYGGIIYFKDAKNKPRGELENNMKLWWPINEAMISSIIYFRDTKNMKYFNQFKKLIQYSQNYMSDKKYGEWYGYLDNNNNKTHTIKGGAYKGCFHVPRALMFSINVLDQIISKHKNISKL